MKNKRNLITITALIGFTTLAAMAPATYWLLIEIAFAEQYYAIFPLIVCLGYGCIAFFSLKQNRATLLITLGIGIPLLVISFIGKVKDFTACDASGPGPFEWINMLSPYATSAIMIVVILRYVLWKRSPKAAKIS